MAARVRTWLTDRFGIAVPVVSAPMAGVTTGRLAAAVSQAGAMGTVAVRPDDTPDAVREQLRLAAAPGRPYGVGLLAWALTGRDELFEVVLDAVRAGEGPALVSVSYGDYQRYLPPLRDAGVTTTTQAGTVADAVAAQDAGVDVVVARGGEAGGHGRDVVGTLPLLQAVLERVSVPVLAAGGIGSARAVAAVLAAGAAGAWVGTAFLTCEEALTRDPVAARLGAVDETGTAYGTVFDVASGAGWPREFGGRAVRNTFFDTWQGREGELAADEEAAARFRSAREAGDMDTMAVYAGQGVALLDGERRPAAAVVEELAGAAALLREAAARVE
jgi:nitronate monooxygenase